MLMMIMIVTMNIAQSVIGAMAMLSGQMVADKKKEAKPT
jgi:hypothetical protein